jgi:hypothetical protein
MADKKLHITETPDTSHIKNIDVTHEMSDVQVGSIAKFVIGLLILTIATHLGLWGMFVALQKSETKKEQTQHRSPLAMTGEERLPPEPRLQSAPGFAESLEKAMPETHNQPRQLGGGEPPRDPLWEIKALHEQWNYVLQHGPTDANGQSYGMPIEQAKDEVVKQLTEKQSAEGRKQ